jgi:predicted  nucleic acid-binding Zn-ribbon protein
MKEPSLDGVIETLKSEDPVAIISNPNNSDRIEELLYYLRDNNVSGLIQHITGFMNKNKSDVVPVLNGIISLYPLTIEVLTRLDNIAEDTSLTIGKSQAIEKLIKLVVRLKNKLSGTGLTDIQKQIKNLEEQGAENKREISKLSEDNKLLEEKKNAVVESGKKKSALQQEKERLQTELDSFSESHLQAQIAEMKTELSKKQKERDLSKKELSNLKEELENVKEIDLSNLCNEIQDILNKSNSNETDKKK